MSSLFEELKRRNVFRVGVAYVVLGWLVIQITETVAPALLLPDWTLSMVIWLGVVGFPFALLFAWAFELTPEGLKRTEDVTPEESVTSHTGQRLTYITFGLMAAVIAMLLAERAGWFGTVDDLPDETHIAVAGESNASNAAQDTLDSIAVLPFVNLSPDQENQHFGDGLAEELLNQLAAIESLRVAARTSSFYFRDKDPTIAEVAVALNVDTVLEGSIQRAGNTIRVVAQLIRASDSAHLWSGKYDRPLDDYFEVQDDIAGHIMQALLPHLDAGEVPASSRQTQISPALFERFLSARQRFYDWTQPAFIEAHEEFLAITEAAPDFARAWAWLARSWLSVSQISGGEVLDEVAFRNARDAIDRALSLDPGDALAYLALGLLERNSNRYEAAEAAFRKSMELDPQLVEAKVTLQQQLAFAGREAEALMLLEEARRIDPLHPEVLWSLAHLYNLKEDYREAFAALEQLYAISAEQGVAMEEHFYSDNDDLAREVNLIEYVAREQPVLGDDSSRAWNAWSLMGYGLYDHPLIAGTFFEPLSLIARGQREAGEVMFAKRGQEWPPNSMTLFIRALTHYALGNYETTRDILQQQWDRSGHRFGVMFHPRHAHLLHNVLTRLGDANESEAMRVALQQDLQAASPLHLGRLRWFKAYYYAFSEDSDRSLDLLSAMVDGGYTGDRTLGSVEAELWPLHGDARFKRLVQRMDENRDAALAELQRLRHSGMTASELRADYLERKNVL